MTTAAKTNFGAELWMAPSGQALVKVAELIEVEPPKPSRDTIDATTHDSVAGAMEFITSGVYDPGEIKLKVNYIANSVGDLAMRTAMSSAVKQDWKVVSKAAAGTSNQTGSGYVSEYGPDAMPVDGLQQASLTLKVSGPIAQS